jgi:hypothetical protein
MVKMSNDSFGNGLIFGEKIKLVSAEIYRLQSQLKCKQSTVAWSQLGFWDTEQSPSWAFLQESG